MAKKKKRGKKLVALVAVAAAVSAVVLGACAKKKADEKPETEDGVSTESAGAGEENSEAGKEAEAELTALLERVQQEVQPGTAGCSLKAAAIAAALLQWGEKKPMSAADAKQITEEYITVQAGEYFSESIALVDEACTDLQSEDAQGLLEDIGLSLTDKTWGDEPLPVVEAVMEAAGLR